MSRRSSREEVARLAREYKMPESDVRLMLAIEAGEITGDVVDVNPLRRATKKAKGKTDDVQ